MVDATQIAQAVANGVSLGVIYALVAVGITLIWGVMKVANFAHGAFVIIAAFASYWAFSLIGIDPILSLLLTVPLLFGLGVLSQKGILRQLMVRSGTSGFGLGSMIVTFGLTLVAEGLMLYFWSYDERSVEMTYLGTKSFLISGVYITSRGLVGVLVTVTTIALVAVLLQKTRVGKGIRAASQDSEVAAMFGVDVDTISGITFGLGAALAAVAGAVISFSFLFSSNADLYWTIKGFMVAVLGGVESVTGALAAGLVFGIAESIASTVGPFSLRELIALIIFVAVLMLRPQGILGRK